MQHRILVVEDDPVLSRVLNDLLVLDGYDVRCVNDGSKAISAAEAFSPDLILLDIMLPGRSGFELCRLWRQQLSIPVIITTARTQKADKLRGLELGADDYVTKPFDPEELAARIRAVLRRVEPQTRSRRAKSSRPGNAAPIRIICVDPQPLVLEGIEALIARQPDMQVIASAGTGEEAIELFNEYRPDVLVMDLQLPHRSGIDTIREIRSAHPDARIVVLTAYHGEEDVFAAIQEGAASYLFKNAFASQLADFIRRVHTGERPLDDRVRALLTDRTPDSALTNREIQVLQLIGRGMQNRDIAAELGITRETVKVHVKNVFLKLNVRARTEAIAVALRRGIIHMS
jgi:DNA-binding NarL/FixJ family response regulator